MIRYEWRSELTAAESGELSGVLQRAAAYDSEPGYSTIDAGDVQRSMADPDCADRHLLIWMLPHATALDEPDTAECIAGIVRLVRTAAGTDEATAVIDPDLRSIGIMTLLLESAGLHSDTTVTAWARGNHPATGRLSNRFLIPRTRRVWRLIRTTAPEHGVSTARVLEPSSMSAINELGWHTGVPGPGTIYVLRDGNRAVGVTTLDTTPVTVEGFGPCATVSHIHIAPAADDMVLRQLLDAAATTAYDEGLSGLIIHVDSDDADLVHACRLTGFQHDRTDVRYQLGPADER